MPSLLACIMMHKVIRCMERNIFLCVRQLDGMRAWVDAKGSIVVVSCSHTVLDACKQQHYAYRTFITIDEWHFALQISAITQNTQQDSMPYFMLISCINKTVTDMHGRCFSTYRAYNNTKAAAAGMPFFGHWLKTWEPAEPNSLLLVYIIYTVRMIIEFRI